MSVDPVASGSTGAAATIDALIAAELNALAADAQALQSQVTVGQVVSAQVLPSNGLTDLISILGNRVAAALPPTLTPGDVFSAQVVGFDGPQILLQILDASAPPPAGETPLPADASPVPLETAPSPFLAAATRPLPDGVTPSVAPPRAVFVAASVRPAPPAAEPAAASPASAGPEPSAPPAAQPAPTAVVLADIEARLAAARAGSIGVNAPSAPPTTQAGIPIPPAPSAPPAPTAAPAANAAPNAGPAAGAGQAAAATRFMVPPPIVPSTRFPDPQGTGTALGRAAEDAAPAGLGAFRDPTALVRALGLPVTPTNVAAAKLALDTPQRLPAALATLESALPDTNDPRVATLRTLAAFIGKIDPNSPRLAEQISAYVDNVVTGNEPKLVQLLAAQLTADQPPDAAPAAAAAPGADEAAAAPPAGPPPEPAVQVLALAMAAERSAALSVDLKTQLLALINAPPAGSEGADDLVPAASSALSAITAVQMNAAQALRRRRKRCRSRCRCGPERTIRKPISRSTATHRSRAGRVRSTATTFTSRSYSTPRTSVR